MNKAYKDIEQARARINEHRRELRKSASWINEGTEQEEQFERGKELFNGKSEWK